MDTGNPSGHMTKRTFIATLIGVLLLTGGAWAAETVRGPVTNLPLPRFVSLKAAEANVRRGPSLSHRIDWVYRRRDLPLQVVAEHGHWRRVEDRDRQGGWIHYALLSGVRTAFVEVEETPLHVKPREDSPIAAVARRGVVARIDECGPRWCRLKKDGHRGWAEKSSLWGVTAGEIID
jgi:SH3-like domain-containing protein